MYLYSLVHTFFCNFYIYVNDVGSLAIKSMTFAQNQSQNQKNLQPNNKLKAKQAKSKKIPIQSSLLSKYKLKLNVLGQQSLWIQLEVYIFTLTKPEVRRTTEVGETERQLWTIAIIEIVFWFSITSYHGYLDMLSRCRLGGHVSLTSDPLVLLLLYNNLYYINKLLSLQLLNGR